VDFDAIPTARERGLALQNFIETRADAVVWDLSNKELTDIRPLSTLTELKMLNIARNSLVDISPLKNLRKLLKLDISSQKNKINSLAPLEEMIQLQDLNCSANAIHDLSPLVKCNDLRELDISHNNITDISPLLNLAKLENLTLSSNPIKNITKLAEHPLLNNLFFTKNSLEIEIIVHPIGDSSNPASFYYKELRLNLTRQEDSNLFLGIYNNKLGVNFQGTVGFYGFQRQLGKCWVLLDISSIISIAASSIKIMMNAPFISVPISEDGQSIIGPAHLVGMNLGDK
jgi:Leucine-rich repeat (LRR) protein